MSIQRGLGLRRSSEPQCGQRIGEFGWRNEYKAAPLSSFIKSAKLIRRLNTHRTAAARPRLSFLLKNQQQAVSHSDSLLLNEVQAVKVGFAISLLVWPHVGMA